MTMDPETKSMLGLSIVLDPSALNDAGWAFISAWDKHTQQSMTGQTWNHIKPMVAAAIQEYLIKAAEATK